MGHGPFVGLYHKANVGEEVGGCKGWLRAVHGSVVLVAYNVRSTVRRKVGGAVQRGIGDPRVYT